jgi:dolichol-phosphate mannosyltransferase
LEIKKLVKEDGRVRLLEFSRNFGKELATTAGINHCRGDACIMMDADLQHPVEILPEFIRRWQEEGIEVLIGVRKNSKSDSFIKRWGGRIFYKIMRMISEVPIIPQATDYRLLDRQVIDVFNQLPERNRITRGLIDWLGFKRRLLYFEANERLRGAASYSTFKLIKLAITSVISLSLFPLRFAGYLGFFIVIISSVLGAVMFIDRYFISWGFSFSGPAILANIILFLVGIVLISLGLLAFYIGHIYHESQSRPLYIIRKRKFTPSDDLGSIKS